MAAAIPANNGRRSIEELRALFIRLYGPRFSLHTLADAISAISESRLYPLAHEKVRLAAAAAAVSVEIEPSGLFLALGVSTRKMCFSDRVYIHARTKALLRLSRSR